MENTLLVALSRQMSLERQIDVIANNVANVNTAGFKADKSLFEEFLRTGAREDNFQVADRRVSFVQDRGMWHNMSQGAAVQTGNPLDVAIDGPGFLVVQTPQGDRYTRNGSLQINATGQLVTNDGYTVLGDGGPITLQPNDRQIQISRDGTLSVREGTSNVDSIRGKIRLVDFANPQQLQKAGNGTFNPVGGAQPQPAASTSGLIQGSIEQSNVRGVVEMSRMIEITRAYTQIDSLLQQQNDLSQSAIDKLADVPT